MLDPLECLPVLAYAVGYGGSMIWFGSSAGVALSTRFPQVRSVPSWLRHGWHVGVGYVLGFAAMLWLLGWHPREPHRSAHQGAQTAPGEVVPAVRE